MGLDEAVVLQAKRDQQDRARNAARLNTLLSPDQRRVCEVMGIDPAAFLAARYPARRP